MWPTWGRAKPVSQPEHLPHTSDSVRPFHPGAISVRCGPCSVPTLTRRPHCRLVQEKSYTSHLIPRTIHVVNPACMGAGNAVAIQSTHSVHASQSDHIGCTPVRYRLIDRSETVQVVYVTYIEGWVHSGQSEYRSHKSEPVRPSHLGAMPVRCGIWSVPACRCRPHYRLVQEKIILSHEPRTVHVVNPAYMVRGKAPAFRLYCYKDQKLYKSFMWPTRGKGTRQPIRPSVRNGRSM